MPHVLPAFRTQEPLLWLVGGGHHHRKQGYYYDARRRDDPAHAALQLTLGGVGFIHRHGGPRVLLPAGRAFFEHIPGPFEYGWASGDYEFVYVSIGGPDAQRWARHVQTLHGPTLEVGADPSVAQTMLALVEASRSGVLRDRYLISGQLYGLLMQLLSVLARRRIAETPLVSACLRIIDAEVDRPDLNVNAMAARLDRSREHLTREFRDVTGVSPSMYLTQTRVRLAAAELRAGDAKLETVARRSGFGSAEYLCRVFRKTVGVTPVQFRRRPWLVAP